MFDKLRNKFIISNLIIASAIIITAFVAIFIVTTANLPSPRHLAATITELDDDATEEIRALLEDRISLNNREHMTDLALVLIFVGLAVEALVFAASCYLAKKSIHPIREAYIKQKEFVANAGHELKTPIAIIQANFESLGATEQPWTGNIETNILRANNVINDLLLLARVDQPKKVIQKIPTNIANLITEQIHNFDSRLTKKIVHLDLRSSPPIALDPADLTQIVSILIDNAIKYSDHTVAITFINKTFTITNDGKTIPKTKLNNIFDRFYRLNKTAEGSGLGLAIARELSIKNNWQLSAASRHGLTTFTLTLSTCILA